eukprot:TRINITY_DN1569_c0_g1_i1.p1 TRINITY_DN1569_c0_g1~~TRINITY_DN1569_c0_g1_i1.p1  ORF type:complete len:349 (-),score=109.22 TRINITY_DN1569_c0_g1_i1:353-1399(-)
MAVNSPTNNMLRWVQQSLSNSNIEVKNLTTSFQNGQVFCALLNHFKPDMIDYKSLSFTPENAESNLKLAFETASKLGIKPLLDAEDVVVVQDQKSIYTYLTFWHAKFGGISTAAPIRRTQSFSQPQTKSLVGTTETTNKNPVQVAGVRPSDQLRGQLRRTASVGSATAIPPDTSTKVDFQHQQIGNKFQPTNKTTEPPKPNISTPSNINNNNSNNNNIQPKPSSNDLNQKFGGFTNSTTTTTTGSVKSNFDLDALFDSSDPTPSLKLPNKTIPNPTPVNNIQRQHNNNNQQQQQIATTVRPNNATSAIQPVHQKEAAAKLIQQQQQEQQQQLQKQQQQQQQQHSTQTK